MSGNLARFRSPNYRRHIRGVDSQAGDRNLCRLPLVLALIAASPSWSELLVRSLGSPLYHWSAPAHGCSRLQVPGRGRRTTRVRSIASRRSGYRFRPQTDLIVGFSHEEIAAAAQLR